MTEKQLQTAIVKLCRAFQLVCVHVPNEGARDPREAGILRAMGVEAGTPDLIVLGAEGKVLWVEVKGPLGKVSPKQADWHAKARALGHDVIVVQSLDAMAEELERRFGWPVGERRPLVLAAK